MSLIQYASSGVRSDKSAFSEVEYFDYSDKRRDALHEKIYRKKALQLRVFGSVLYKNAPRYAYRYHATTIFIRSH